MVKPKSDLPIVERVAEQAKKDGPDCPLLGMKGITALRALPG